jgi:hypothetical protein
MKRRGATWSLCLAAAVVFVVGGPGVSVPAPAADRASTQDAEVDGVVAFYFHGNVRCATCKRIEAYADDAIHRGFAQALQTSALTWRVVNVEEPENRHFIEDFQLVTRSVVLAEYRDDKIVRWKNLDKVWQLVRDKDGFTSYVQSETREFLGEG